MKYPRLPFELDKRRKLTLEQINKIQELRQRGYSYRKLGRIFNISKNTVHYHCDILFREKLNKQRYLLLKKQRQENPKWAKEQRKKINKQFLQNTKIYEPQRIFKGKNTYKWKKKKYHNDSIFREKTKKQARENYRKRRKC